MEYTVGKIPATSGIDADRHGQARERKKGLLVRRADENDSVSISDEARRRSDEAEDASADQVTK